MSLLDINIRSSYDSENTDFARDFFVPVLSHAVSYDRAVGYFSSSALVSITRGLYHFFKKGGRLRVLASPFLSKEDYRAIETGEKNRSEAALDALLRSLESPKTEEEIDRLNILAYMIASGRCEIRIAFTKNSMAMYHEKIAVITDEEGNAIAFTGSLNETGMAFHENYESIDVYRSWSADAERVAEKKEKFESLWDGRNSRITTKRFVEIEKHVIKRYLRKERPLSIPKSEKTRTTNKGPIQPDNIQLYEYQMQAVANFMGMNGRGIFAMATGSGKTITALSAMTELSQSLNNNLGVLIVVPYRHLIDQWLKDIRAYGISHPIICCGDSPMDWQLALHLALTRLENRGQDPFFCAIATVATFSSEKFQFCLNRYENEPLLIIADEAHNLGASKAQKALRFNYLYRLALSATFDRHHDTDGTQVLYDFFGKICIEFTLKQAIDGGFLTPYEYHPIFVSMSDNERAEYISLTKKIGRAMAKNNGESSQQAEMLEIKRSRLIANIKSKIPAFVQAIRPFVKDSFILVYCGPSVSYDPTLEELRTDNYSKSQIEQIVREVSQLGMTVITFTSSKNSEDRERIKRVFASGSIQVLVAIKCLDEGVSISGIQKAFILASTTNPKEYIQRRGRVLRKAEGKEKADIYDFVVLPYPIESLDYKTFLEIQDFQRLVANELMRYREFSELSLNDISLESIFLQLCSRFQLDPSLPSLLPERC